MDTYMGMIRQESEFTRLESTQNEIGKEKLRRNMTRPQIVL